MSLSDVINLTITEVSAAVTRPGFGTLGIFDYNTRYTSNLVRRYTSTAAMISDGFNANDAAVKAAAAAFAQSPAPVAIKVLRRTAAPTFAGKLTPIMPTVAAVTVFSGKVATPANPSGTAFTFTSDSSPSIAEVCTGLTSAINGGTGTHGVTATDNTTYVGLAASAGVIVSFYALNASQLGASISFEDDTPDNSCAAQLSACLVEDSDFYGVTSTSNGAAEISAIAAWAETNKKLFGAQTHDSGCKGSGTSDIMSTLKAAAYTHTYCDYFHNLMEFPAAAYTGKLFPYDPGSETWAFKTLAGVTVSILTDAEQSNIAGKNGGYYVTLAGRNVTFNGKVASGDFIDNQRFIDWFYTNLQLDLFALFASTPKVPNDDSGGVQIEAVIRARFALGESAGGFVRGSSVVSVPSASTESSADRAARNYPGITGNATLAGAVHSAQLNLTVSV